MDTYRGLLSIGTPAETHHRLGASTRACHPSPSVSDTTDYPPHSEQVVVQESSPWLAGAWCLTPRSVGSSSYGARTGAERSSKRRSRAMRRRMLEAPAYGRCATQHTDRIGPQACVRPPGEIAHRLGARAAHSPPRSTTRYPTLSPKPSVRRAAPHGKTQVSGLARI